MRTIPVLRYKAMIFVAGLGTRLHPITETVPKALVKIGKKSLLEIVIKRLIRYGFNDIIINVHHFSVQIIEFIESKNKFGINIQFSDETDQLLETGGGLKKASWFFDDGKPFLVHNVDVISNIDLNKMMEFHLETGALATLAVRNRITSRYLLFDENDVLCGWENVKTNERKIIVQKPEYFPYAFSGIHIINPAIFNYISDEGKFSIIDVYLKLARDHRILCYKHNESLWLDLGRKENLKEAEKIINRVL
ncbi:MAG: nucleotidyltransferase family protein [Bacteroidales bacterium]|nr:nucleotidyltransferase family protein [Bacteroidales bacterium]